MAAMEASEGPFWATKLPPAAASVPEARHFTSEVLHQLGADDTSERAELLVSELATNAVLHAGSPMRLTVWRYDHRVRVEVRDDDPHRPRHVEPDPLTPGGRGMLLVDALSLAWGINSNEKGKTVWFELAEGGS
jgi:anti-sigma regulatory factor (Ser/Thr protein kinase)